MHTYITYTRSTYTVARWLYHHGYHRIRLVMVATIDRDDMRYQDRAGHEVFLNNISGVSEYYILPDSAGSHL